MGNYDSFIFSHIPKCGGTSVRQLIFKSAISSEVKSNNIYIPGYNGLKVDKNLVQLNSLQLRSFSKLNIKVAAMHVPYNVHVTNNSLGKNPLYFTLFRDPFERFLSHYYFFYYRQGADGCKGQHLSQLPDQKRVKLIHNLSNIYSSYILGEIKSGLFSDIGFLDKLIDKLLSPNYSYGLLSDVNKALKLLSKKLPTWFQIHYEMPKVNVHNFSSTYEDFVDDSLEQEFIHYNQLDILLYDYIVKSLAT